MLLSSHVSYLAFIYRVYQAFVLKAGLANFSVIILLRALFPSENSF